MRTNASTFVCLTVVAVAMSACSAAPDTTGSSGEASSTAGAALDKTQVPDTSLSLPPSVCGFQVDIATVSNNEYQTVTTLTDGTVITRIRGELRLSFTNHDTGKSIVRNVSGPTDETDFPDGSGTKVGEGLNWWGFGPHSQANTGEPGLVITSGKVVLTFADGNVTGFELHGRQTNLCELLQ
jgi:hypothetical protein